MQKILGNQFFALPEKNVFLEHVTFRTTPLIYGLYQVCISNFNILAQLRGEIREEQSFLKVQKWGKAPNRPRRQIFGYVIQLWIAYRLA